MQVVEPLIQKNWGNVPYRDAKIKVHWQDIVGIELAEKCKPLRLDKNTLVIVSESSTLNHHLMIMKNEIIDKINNYLSGKFIRDLFFINGSLNNYKYIEQVNNDLINITKEKMLQQIQLSREDYQLIKKITDQVEDEILRQSFTELLIMDKKYKKFLNEHGYIKCPTCNRMIEQNKSSCIFCKKLTLEKTRQDLEVILQEVPQLSFVDCQKYLKCDKMLYDDVKTKLIKKYQEKIARGIFKQQEKMILELLLDRRS